jgi:hypothetical protein
VERVGVAEAYVVFVGVRDDCYPDNLHTVTAIRLPGLISHRVRTAPRMVPTIDNAAA